MQMHFEYEKKINEINWKYTECHNNTGVCVCLH